MAIPVKLEQFEGPLDLLLHLIDINKIDIYDIPIVTITDQYLAYVAGMEEADMNITSEFMVMAATLLDIKCRMLLPKEKDEEGNELDPRDELVEKLLEYKLYKAMSYALKDREQDAAFHYYRRCDLPKEVKEYVPPVDYDRLIGDNTLLTLQSIFEDVRHRAQERIDPVRSTFGTIRREEINMGERARSIRSYLMEHPRTDFRSLLEQGRSKEEVVVSFLVILELMKTGMIRILQEETFGEIAIEVPDAEALGMLDIGNLTGEDEEE